MNLDRFLFTSGVRIRIYSMLALMLRQGEQLIEALREIRNVYNITDCP